MSTAAQAGLPSRVAVRWYRLALIVLGVALAAVTALAISLAVQAASPTPIPVGNPGSGADHPCVKLHDPC